MNWQVWLALIGCIIIVWGWQDPPRPDLSSGKELK